MKILQLTDIHLLPAGEKLRDIDPAARLRACLSDISAKHNDAAALIVTGDVVDRAEVATYEFLKDILSEYPLPPVHITIGNHDRRSVFAQVFPEMVDDKGYAQQRIDLGDHVGLVLDTFALGTHGGELDDDRLAWLDSQLRAQQQPIFIFMHHAPFKIGLKRPDQITLQNEDEFWHAIEPFRDRIKHLFFGHMHRSISGVWRGIPFTVAASLGHQTMLDFETAMIRIQTVEPGYSVILVADGNVIVHPHTLRDLPVIEMTPGTTPTYTQA
jgi:3',5'-cyclic AMP phosphodiesterase CpdA